MEFYILSFNGRKLAIFDVIGLFEQLSGLIKGLKQDLIDLDIINSYTK